MKKIFWFIGGVVIVPLIVCPIVVITRTPQYALAGFFLIILARIILAFLRLKIYRAFDAGLLISVILTFLFYPPYYESTEPHRVIYRNTEMISNNPDYSEGYYLIGIAYARLHKPEEAKENFQKAKELYLKQNNREGLRNVEKQLKKLGMMNINLGGG